MSRRPSGASAAKRKAPSPASAAASPRGKRAKKQDGISYQEGRDGGIAPSAAAARAVQEEVESREFWERWDTALARAWLVDFKHKLSKNASREDIVSTLVTRRNEYPPPKPEVALSELQRIWRQRNKGKGEPPGELGAHGGSEEDDADENDEEEVIAPVVHLKQRGQVTVAGSRPRASDFMHPLPIPSGIAQEPISTSVKSPECDFSCHWCGSEAPSGKVASRAWKCEDCGMRGDIAGGDINAKRSLAAAGSSSGIVISVLGVCYTIIGSVSE